MNFKVEVQPDAENDLADAVFWYESHSIGLGTELLISFKAATHQIQNHPFAYAAKYKIKTKEIRVTFVNRFPYGVYFFVEENTIQIIAVMHAKRSERNWKKRI